MKTMVKVGLILLPTVLVLCLFPGCQTEEVADFSEETRTEDVVGGLADSASQVEAEAAIRDLFSKAEIGTAFPESGYGTYAFSDEGIADLAELHLLYLNSEVEPSLEYMFEAVMRVSDSRSVPEAEFGAAMSVLEGQTADERHKQQVHKHTCIPCQRYLCTSYGLG